MKDHLTLASTLTSDVTLRCNSGSECDPGLVNQATSLIGYPVIVWEPEAQRGEAKRGRPKQSYLSTLIRDVGTKTKEELRTLMRDRDLRRISAIDLT